MITTQHLVHIQHKNEWKWAQTMGVSAEGKLVTMRFEGGGTFTMKTEGQDTTTGYPTLRDAIPRTFPTLVWLSQLTEPDCIYGIENRGKGKRKIGWAQAVYPLRARLQELRETNLHPERQDDTLEDDLTDLRISEQAFMAVNQNWSERDTPHWTQSLASRKVAGSGSIASGNYTCNIMSFNFKRHNNTYEFLQRHNYVL